jgi:hypothetical protein
MPSYVINVAHEGVELQSIRFFEEKRPDKPNTLFNTSRPRPPKWDLIMPFLDINDATSLAFFPEGRGWLKSYIHDDRALVTLVKFGMVNRFNVMIDKLERLKNQETPIVFNAKEYKQECQKFCESFLLIMMILGAGIYGAARLFSIATSGDNDLQDYRDQVGSIVSTFLMVCSNITANPDFVYQDVDRWDTRCDYYALKNCNYQIDECNLIANVMMLCNSTLWSNYTNACEQEAAFSDNAIYFLPGLFLVFAMIGLVACIVARCSRNSVADVRLEEGDYPAHRRGYFLQRLAEDVIPMQYFQWIKGSRHRTSEVEKHFNNFYSSAILGAVERFKKEVDEKYKEINSEIELKNKYLEEQGDILTPEIAKKELELRDLKENHELVKFNHDALHVSGVSNVGKLSCSLFYKRQQAGVNAESKRSVNTVSMKG